MFFGNFGNILIPKIEFVGRKSRKMAKNDEKYSFMKNLLILNAKFLHFEIILNLMEKTLEISRTC